MANENRGGDGRQNRTRDRGKWWPWNLCDAGVPRCRRDGCWHLTKNTAIRFYELQLCRDPAEISTRAGAPKYWWIRSWHVSVSSTFWLTKWKGSRGDNQRRTLTIRRFNGCLIST